MLGSKRKTPSGRTGGGQVAVTEGVPGILNPPLCRAVVPGCAGYTYNGQFTDSLLALEQPFMEQGSYTLERSRTRMMV